MVGAAVTWPPKGDNDTMTMRPFVLPPEQRERALNVLGTQVTVLASNTATQSYGITLQQGDEGTGPPPHRHDWDEAFFVLKGVIEFVCDGKAATCTPGTLVHVPRGTVHGFTYGPGAFGDIYILAGRARSRSSFPELHSWWGKTRRFQ